MLLVFVVNFMVFYCFKLYIDFDDFEMYGDMIFGCYVLWFVCEDVFFGFEFCECVFVDGFKD